MGSVCGKQIRGFFGIFFVRFCLGENGKNPYEAVFEYGREDYRF